MLALYNEVVCCIELYVKRSVFRVFVPYRIKAVESF